MSRESTARRLVARLHGRFSTELGIDVDRGAAQVERWAFAAALFGTRISAAIAARTYRRFADAGAPTLREAARLERDARVQLLNAGGYARYDFRTADRIEALAAQIDASALHRWSCIDNGFELERQLDSLPGWGPVTVQAFLRELRGVWPGAVPALDLRALWAARHIGLLADETEGDRALDSLEQIAEAAGLDGRDLEVALVRLSLRHEHDAARCPGGDACAALAPDAGATGDGAVPTPVVVARDGSTCAVGAIDAASVALSRRGDPNACGPPE